VAEERKEGLKGGRHGWMNVLERDSCEGIRSRTQEAAAAAAAGPLCTEAGWN